MTRLSRRGKLAWVCLVTLELVLLWQLRPVEPLSKARAESWVTCDSGLWPWQWEFFRRPKLPSPIAPTPRQRGGVPIS